MITMHTRKGKTGYGNSHSIDKCKCFTWNICSANSEKIVQVYSKIIICTHIFIGKICTIANFQLSNICSTKPNWEVYAVRSINYSWDILLAKNGQIWGYFIFDIFCEQFINFSRLFLKILCSSKKSLSHNKNICQ